MCSRKKHGGHQRQQLFQAIHAKSSAAEVWHGCWSLVQHQILGPNSEALMPGRFVSKVVYNSNFFGWHWLMDVNGLWVSVLYSMNLLCFFQKTHLFYKAPASCLAVKNRQKSTGDSPWGAWPWPPGPSGGQLAQCALTKNFMVGGLEHGFYDFPYIGNNHPNWLPYFSEG